MNSISTFRIAFSIFWLAAFQAVWAKKGQPDGPVGGPCTLNLTIQFLDTISCPGLTDGGVYLGVTAAQGSVNYFLDSNPVPFTNPSMPNVVGAGNHQVVAIDGMGCRDTVYFQLFDPPAISITSATATDATCNGENSGTATATAMGGRPPLAFAWQSCQGGVVQAAATALNLYAGCYRVTVTDSQGCTKTEDATVGEPSAFAYSFVTTDNKCYKDSIGTATISVTGNTPPYSYAWPSGQTTPTGSGLPAGFHAPTVTDAAGCKVVALVQIFQPGQISLSTSRTNVSCNGLANGTMKIDAVSGGTGPYSFAWSGGTVAPGGQSTSGLAPGIFFVTITDANGCTKTASQIITQPNGLQINANATKESCFGTCDGKINLTVTFGQAPFSFAWAGPTNPGSVEDPQNLCAGSYTVTVTDAAGCTEQKASVSVAAANPIILQAQVTQPDCSGNANGAITAQAFGGASGFGYQWSHGPATATVQNLLAGTFTVTVTDATGCKKDSTFQVSPPPPVLIDSISVVSPIKCFGQKGAIRVFPAGGTAPFSFKWNDPTSQIAQTASNLSAGAFAVTVTDGKGCTATASKSLSQPAILAATATASSADCFGQPSGQVTLVPMGGTTPYLYGWSNGATAQNLFGVPVGAYTVTVSDKNACSTTAAATVDGPSSPVSVSAMQTFTSCAFENKSTADATATGGNGQPFSFAWQGGQTTSKAVNLAPGLYEITASDAKGCTAVSDVLVAELAPIVLGVATDSTKCFGDQTGTAGVNIVSGGNGNGAPANYTFQWNTVPPQTSILATSLAGGTSYTVTATDGQGCKGTATATVPSAAAIVISTSFEHVSCAGGSDGRAEVVSVATPQPVSGLVWSPNAGGATTFAVQNLVKGVYEVTVTNQNGCTEVAAILINEPLPITINFVLEQLFCNGDSTGAAFAIPSGGNGSGSAASYAFSWSNGSVSDRNDGLKAGNYGLTVTDQKGCTGAGETTISQPNPLEIELKTTSPTCFEKKDGRVEVEATGGKLPYFYALGSPDSGGNGNGFFTGLGSGEVRVFVRDGGGCTTLAIDTLIAPEKLTVELGPDLEIMLGDSAALVPTVTGGQGEIEFVWRSEFPSDDHCMDSICAILMASPTSSIHYWINATDEKGCMGSDFLKIKVDKTRGFFVPTGFTPNADGANDRLIVHGKTKTVQRVVVFRIFDRWGEKVFEDRDFGVNDETRGWDGLFGGKPLDPGEFVWWAEVEYIDGFRESAKGATLLIR